MHATVLTLSGLCPLQQALNRLQFLTIIYQESKEGRDSAFSLRSFCTPSICSGSQQTLESLVLGTLATRNLSVIKYETEKSAHNVGAAFKKIQRVSSIVTSSIPIRSGHALVRKTFISLHSATLQASLRLSLISLHTTNPRSLVPIDYCVITFGLYSFLATTLPDNSSPTRLSLHRQGALFHCTFVKA